MIDDKETSDFGKGLCYCLGLFLAHQAELKHSLRQYAEVRKTTDHPSYYSDKEAYRMWFYSAGDHLFDFQPDSAPNGLKARCRAFKDRVLHLRGYCTDPMPWGEEPSEESARWAIQEAKDLLRDIDAAHGVPTLKGDYE